MTESSPCPDCGQLNPVGSASCGRCNYPLVADDPTAVAAASSAKTSAPSERAAPAPAATNVPAAEPVREAAPAIPRPRPIRARRPRPQQNMLSIWLLGAAVTAAAALVIAIRGYHQTNSQPIEGAKAEQQKRADEFRAVLDRDSTDVTAQVGLADVLFDTGNWSDAIIHYRAAIARDSSRATTLVDLGVCYYNLSDAITAEKLFLLALQRDPKQAIALFNLGVVNERKGDNRAALAYLHRALEAGPPESMRQALMETMDRVQKAVGEQPPTLKGRGAK